MCGSPDLTLAKNDLRDWREKKRCFTVGKLKSQSQKILGNEYKQCNILKVKVLSDTLLQLEKVMFGLFSLGIQKRGLQRFLEHLV